MRKSRFGEKQIFGVLRDHRMASAEILAHDPEHLSGATVPRSTARFPGMRRKAAAVVDIGGLFQIFSILANGTKAPWNNTKEMLDKTVDLLIKFKKEQALTIRASYGDLAALLGNGEVVIAQSWEPVSQ